MPRKKEDQEVVEAPAKKKYTVLADFKCNVNGVVASGKIGEDVTLPDMVVPTLKRLGKIK